MHLINLESMPVESRREKLTHMLGGSLAPDQPMRDVSLPGIHRLGTKEKILSAQAPEAQARAVNEDERTITYVFTSSAVDRFQEIVDPHGADLRAFRQAKRTVFWNHNYNHPVGRSLWEKQEGEKWVGKVQFAGETDMARDIWNLAKAGYIGMTSVGFIPSVLEIAPLDEVSDLHPANRGEFNPKTSVWVWRKWELLEYSIVGIGANPEAIETSASSVESYEKILRNGLVQSDALRNMLIAEIQEKRLCELESCKERMTEMPDMIARLLNRIEVLENQFKEITPVTKQRDFANNAQHPPAGTVAALTREQLEELTRAIVRGAVSRIKGRVS